MSRPIALPACKLLGPTVPDQGISTVFSRRPAASELASESQLRSPGGISRPAGHPARGTRAPSRAPRVSIHSVARGQSTIDLLANPRATGRCEPRVAVLTERRQLRSSRVDLAVFRGCDAIGASIRLWGCAGRSYLSHSTSRSPAIWWERGAWREQVALIQPQAGIGRILVWAYFVRRKLSPNPAYSNGKRASRCSRARDSKHTEGSSAGLF